MLDVIARSTEDGIRAIAPCRHRPRLEIQVIVAVAAEYSVVAASSKDEVVAIAAEPSVVSASREIESFPASPKTVSSPNPAKSESLHHRRE